MSAGSAPTMPVSESVSTGSVPTTPVSVSGSTGSVPTQSTSTDASGAPTRSTGSVVVDPVSSRQVLGGPVGSGNAGPKSTGAAWDPSSDAAASYGSESGTVDPVLVSMTWDHSPLAVAGDPPPTAVMRGSDPDAQLQSYLLRLAASGQVSAYSTTTSREVASDPNEPTVACPLLGLPPTGSACPAYPIPGLAPTGSVLVVLLASGLILLVLGWGIFRTRARRRKARPARRLRPQFFRA